MPIPGGGKVISHKEMRFSMRRNRSLSLFIAIAVLAIITACNPSGSNGNPIIIQNPGSKVESVDFVSQFSTSQILQDIAAEDPRISVEYKVLEDSGAETQLHLILRSSDSVAASSSPVNLQAIATFTDYVLNGKTLNGSLVFTILNATKDESSETYSFADATYTASTTDDAGTAYTLSVSIGTRTQTVSVAGLEGTIATGSITINADSTGSMTATSVEEDTFKGSFTVGTEEIPAAEANEEFAEGGNGTEQNPYIVTSLDELKKLSNLSGSETVTYVRLSNSLTIDANDAIPAFSNIILDGGNNTISISGTPDDSDEDSVRLFTSVQNSTIKNLTYAIENSKSFIRETHGDVTLENITLEGLVTVESNNTSGFVTYAYPITGSGEDSTLSFINCTNNADFIDTMGCYGAPFVAIALASNSNVEEVNLVFTDCTNNGYIFYANGVGLLVGNMYKASQAWFYPGTITVEGFRNTNTVTGFKRAEFVNGMSNTAHDAEKGEWGAAPASGADLIKPLEGGDVGITSSSEGKISFDVSNLSADLRSDAEEVTLVGYVYVGYTDGGLNGEKVGNYASYSIELIDPIDISSTDMSFDAPVTKVCNSTTAAGAAADADGIVTVGETKYWYIDLPRMYAYFGSDQDRKDSGTFSKYCAIVRNAEGRIIAMSDVTSTMQGIIQN